MSLPLTMATPWTHSSTLLQYKILFLTLALVSAWAVIVVGTPPDVVDLDKTSSVAKIR